MQNTEMPGVSFTTGIQVFPGIGAKLSYPNIPYNLKPAIITAADFGANLKERRRQVAFFGDFRYLLESCAGVILTLEPGRQFRNNPEFLTHHYLISQQEPGVTIVSEAKLNKPSWMFSTPFYPLAELKEGEDYKVTLRASGQGRDVDYAEIRRVDANLQQLQGIHQKMR